MLQRKFKFLRPKYNFYIICILFLSFTSLFGVLSVLRHNHFQSQGIDFSIYDQALWLYSKGEIPFSTITNLHDLADRFRPIMVLVSILFRFTEDVKVLLLFQATILAATAFPIWLLARRHLSKFLAIIIPFLYLIFVGTQSVNIYDFHEMSVLPFFLAFLFYFLDRGMWKSFFLALVLCLSVREHVGLLLAFISIFIYREYNNFILAVVTFLVSLSWSILSIKVIMPALGQQSYGSFLDSGDTMFEAVLTYLTNPFLAIKNYFIPIVKTETQFWTFASFGFLPLLAFSLMPVIFFQFAYRFLDMMHPIRWTLYYHYGVELGVLLAISTIYSARMMLNKFKWEYMQYGLIIFLLTLSLASNLILNAPLKNLAKTDFWEEKEWMRDTKSVLALIPDNASAAGQNNLLPHISHRKALYLLPNVNNAEFVVVDLHPGQNGWNFYTLDLEGMQLLMNDLVRSRAYDFYAVSGDAYLLKNTNGSTTQQSFHITGI